MDAHCPACGEAVKIEPTVKSVEKAFSAIKGGDVLLVTLRTNTIRHDCP